MMRLTAAALMGAIALCAGACGDDAGPSAGASPSAASPSGAPARAPTPGAGSSVTETGSSTGFDPAFSALPPRDRLRHVVALMHGRGVLLVTRRGAENAVTANGLEATDVEVVIDACALLDPCRRGSALVLRQMRLMGDPPPLSEGGQAVVFLGPENSGPSSFGGGDTADRIAVHGTSVLAVHDGTVNYGGAEITPDDVLALATEHLPWPDPA